MPALVYAKLYMVFLHLLSSVSAKAHDQCHGHTGNRMMSSTCNVPPLRAQDVLLASKSQAEDQKQRDATFGMDSYPGRLSAL